MARLRRQSKFVPVFGELGERCTRSSRKCHSQVDARRERPNWGPALLMRPAEAAPAVPFVTLPLHWNPNACASDYRGVSDPVVPFKPPCLTSLNWYPADPLPTGAHNFFSLQTDRAARPAALADLPIRLQTRPLGSFAADPAMAAGTAYDRVIRKAA